MVRDKAEKRQFSSLLGKSTYSLRWIPISHGNGLFGIHRILTTGEDLTRKSRIEHRSRALVRFSHYDPSRLHHAANNHKAFRILTFEFHNINTVVFSTISYCSQDTRVFDYYFRFAFLTLQHDKRLLLKPTCHALAAICHQENVRGRCLPQNWLRL